MILAYSYVSNSRILQYSWHTPVPARVSSSLKTQPPKHNLAPFRLCFWVLGKKEEEKIKGMAKEMMHVESGGGNVKKRMMKRRRKKKNIHKVIDYLLSDCYLFAPLISPSPFNSYRAPRKGSSFISDIEFRERPKDHRSFLKKMVDYLKSDCYMYASLVAPQSFKGT